MPAEATGRVIVRGDTQVATRRLADGTFTIVTRRRVGSGWTDTTTIFMAPPGTFAMASSLSPDGRRLYFETNARTPAVEGREDTDLWVLDRSEAGWGAARPLGHPFALPSNEHAPSAAADGTLCVNAARPGGVGENDIYCSPDGQMPPVLAADLSSPAEDAFAMLSSDGMMIVFASNRPGGLGGWDLYAARRVAGAWSTPVNLGAPINSAADDLHPCLDGEDLYLVRIGPQGRALLKPSAWR
jgi:hypothetical protein